MLIVCNGAIKSGSTWLFKILTGIVDCQSPPDHYLTGNNPKHPCIKPDAFETFLACEDTKGFDYISKNHLSKNAHKELLLNHPDTYVFDIVRDPRDVIVSNYYHERFRHNYEGSFDEFYWSKGRTLAAFLSRYHSLWEPDGKRIYRSSYECLQSDFSKEVRAIAEFIGHGLSDAEVEALRERTAMRTLRKEYEDEPQFEGEKFFRKGIVGDWKNHFDDKMSADITKIGESGVPPTNLSRIISAIRSRVLPAR